MSDALPDYTDDRPLALHLSRGDDAAAREAFATIFRMYYALVVRFVQRYVVARETAEDIAQETFVRLWDRRATLDPERPLRAFLFASARNRAVNVLAHDAVARAHVEREFARQAALPSLSHAPAADESTLTDELARVTAARVAALPPRQREIYQLSREGGLSPAEIAETLGIAPTTVYVQLARIVQALFPALAAWTQDG